jgi:Mn-dependent DtxR family transcriptional regulator
MTDVPTWNPWSEEYNRRPACTQKQDHEDGFFTRGEIAERLGTGDHHSKFLKMLKRLTEDGRIIERPGIRIRSDGRAHAVTVLKIRDTISHGQEEDPKKAKTPPT